MTPTSPEIVATLSARSVEDARLEIREAHAAGADLAEVRLDRFRADQLEQLGELFPSRIPLVATLRSRAEGGEGPDDPDHRARLLGEIARHPFRWVDVERARDFPFAESLARPGVQDLIVSSHISTEVRSDDWHRLLREPVPPGSIRKVVARASVARLLRDLLPDVPPAGDVPLTAMTTGPSGPLLRAWSKGLGFPLVYASLPEHAPGTGPSPVEPSQVPVDRLRRYLRGESTPPLFAIVGHPVAHSRSPAIHSHWMTRRGVAGLFVALDFETEREFVESVPLLAERGFRGLSVTHPYKQAAVGLASEVGPGASACGVANTLTFRTGETEVENTDLVAILRRLEELRASGRWDGRSVGVIGAGGAARATLAAARSLGVDALVWARRAEPAERLAREFSATAVYEPERARPSLVVHATTVGRAPAGVSAVPDLSWLRPGIHTLDWVYAPDDPIVRVTAERAGATYEDGSRLLVYQAAAAFGIWWGTEPTREETDAALEEAR